MSACLRTGWLRPWAEACILLFVLGGCARQGGRVAITNLEYQYGIGFKTLSAPDANGIRQSGISRSVAGASYEQVWLAALKVALQRGPIVRADHTSGIIIAPPFALLITKSEQQFRVYAAFMDELYLDSQDSKQVVVALKREEKEFYTEDIVGAIATQAAVADNLKLGGKWSFLLE